MTEENATDRCVHLIPRTLCEACRPDGVILVKGPDPTPRPAPVSHIVEFTLTSEELANLRPGPVVIQERAKIRGDFRDQSEASQALKHVMRNAAGWNRLSAAQQEALEHIANKIARVLTGDPDEADAWLDMAGYPTLIHNILTRGSPT